ncbi:ribonuclease HII [Bradyrhizobium sp. U87765 SZCCT0131]|uniref:ribonuclease HII n=1 Tax=unclassified Bradyrhizobium TaxID=2631580 RepID=UPI001BA78E6A|nr:MULTISPECIES: ribonuclease HII [unclassified Bradyrhizobium]MBR1218137.1 ribonuclease HII [Bradyrhizobium sp. U87765 SZCCT0131]MBR1260917.1 ribonuclease HII [Bradyrhizobium sp. U87765 SZCCT0134]MBR1303635.1 ribonuclease HII [Bradyrhizobium sp. U87765 SZCCT0110]MBR1319241.1 ribonuclease HII [Bradyrhizobium sp. U87765 SZCCT0109]MBR1347566.1 ribonuclease HII [Bradyrhizobium sp. U87765 SZCCT0048]
MIRDRAPRKPTRKAAAGPADAPSPRGRAKVAAPARSAATTPPNFRRERALLKRGVWPVAGCDEVGRGPLAGPVVAAAVILDPDRVPKGLDDSKRLTRERREALFEEICATASFAVAVAPPSRIERDNILRASLWALARAVDALPQAPQHVFVDGRDRIDVPCGCDAVIGGDGLVVSIAAASIVAKVVRDRLMGKLAEEHPGYGFEQHMGYGVPLHLAALDTLGPTAHHRRLFAPVAAAWRKHGGDLPEEPAAPEPDTQADLFEALAAPV